MAPPDEARLLAWARSRFDRHIAGKAPENVDLALLEEVVADLSALGAVELPEREKLLAEVRRAQTPETASETLWWGHVANQQYEITRYQIGRTRIPFESLRPALYSRVIRRLTEIRAAMDTRPSTALLEQNKQSVGRNLTTLREELADLERMRGALDEAGLRAALGRTLDELEKSWSLLTAPHPSVLDLPELGSILDRLFECTVQLDALGASPEAGRAHALANAWLPIHAGVVAAQTIVPDTTLPTARTKPVKLVPHKEVDRTRALRTLLGDLDDCEDEDDSVPLPIRMKRGGELLLLPQAIAVFATVGPRNTRSHFAERHLFRWLAFRDRTWDYHHDLRSEQGRAGGPRPTSLFVRLAGDKTYFYAGAASVVASREKHPRPGVWVDLELEQAIPLDAWRRFGGFRRIVTSGAQDYGFPLDPGRFAKWVQSATNSPHIDLVSETGAKLTVHGAGPRVELVYRDAPNAVALHSIDASTTAEPVDVVCACGHTRELRASDTVTRAVAVDAMTAFMEEDTQPPGLGVRSAQSTDNAWLARYRAGEHIAVWDEIRALGPNVRSAEHLPRAMEVLRAMMLRVRSNIDRIIVRLRELLYKFEQPDKVHVPPTEAARAALASPPEGVPLCLTAFVGIVGTVNLVQSEGQVGQADVHARATLGVLGQEGPLELEAAPSVAPLAPDSWPIFREDCLKAGFSGDYHYIDLPDSSADTQIHVVDTPIEWFIDYLRATLAQGGFRGHMCGDPAHTDARGFGRVPRAFAYFLSRDLEPF